LHLYNRLMIKWKIYSSLKYVGVVAANVVLLAKAAKISSIEDSSSRYTRYQTVEEVPGDNKLVSYHEAVH